MTNFRKLNGFTLLEMMVVVAILGIIAAIALPSYDHFVEKSNLAAAKNEMVDVVARMNQNKLKNSTDYSAAGLTALLSEKNSLNSLSGKYRFASGGTFPQYHIYLQPQRSGWQKSLYLTEAGRVYECKTQAAAQSKSASDCTVMND